MHQHVDQWRARIDFSTTSCKFRPSRTLMQLLNQNHWWEHQNDLLLHVKREHACYLILFFFASYNVCIKPFHIFTHLLSIIFLENTTISWIRIGLTNPIWSRSDLIPNNYVIYFRKPSIWICFKLVYIIRYAIFSESCMSHPSCIQKKYIFLSYKGRLILTKRKKIL